jgi:hypothetical protein
VNHPQIAVFARLAKENTPYVRSIEGQKTLLSRTMHDFSYDAIHDEIVVTSPLTQAILTFRGGADGEEAPIRVIQGSKTGIFSVGAADKVTIDAMHSEVYITTPNQEVRVFAREANGDVAPIRILSGPDTQLSTGVQRVGLASGKGGGNPRVRVDPINNLLLVPSTGGSRILIFDRTASGNTKPRAIMRGASMGTIYPEKRRLITHSRGNIEIWNIPDHGEVTEPFLRIPAPLDPRAYVGGGGEDRGGGVMDIDPSHKEVIFGTAAANTVVTFSVPELFD